jgi:hypothetical protein
MNGLMVSLNIFLLAGTAVGQQAADDAASMRPALRSLPAASSMSAFRTDNQFERPGPDDSAGDWPTPESVLGDQSTITSRSASMGGQTTNFGGRSERASNPQPTSAMPSQGIRFDVMLRPEDLESVKRGGTLVAPVEIRNRQNAMLGTDVVSDIAFFHEANKGRSTDGEFIWPEAIEPGSRKLRFKLTADQLDRMDNYAYQFRVPSNMRGEFDQVEFVAEGVGDGRSLGSDDFGGSWNTASKSASNLPRPNDGIDPGFDPGFGRPLGNGNDGFRNPGVDVEPEGSGSSNLGNNWERKNRFDSSASRQLDSNPNERFNDRGFDREQDRSVLGQRTPQRQQETLEMAQMRRRLEETQRLAQQALAERKRWEDESLKLADEKSFLARKNNQLVNQLDAASRVSDPKDGSTLMRPISTETKPFGSRRNDFGPVADERDRQLELANREIERLKQKNLWAEQENQSLATNYDKLESASKQLYDQHNLLKQRRSTSETTDMIANALRDPRAMAGVNPAVSNRIASNTAFAPPERTPVGLGSMGAQVATGGNPNLGGGNYDYGAAQKNKNNANVKGKGSDVPDKTSFFLWFLLLPSIGLNFYLSILCRSLYVRYQDLADELREMFSATSA